MVSNVLSAFQQRLMAMIRAKKAKALNEQYRWLRDSALVGQITLESPVGCFDIKSAAVIRKVLDLLIHETQMIINKELEE